MHCACPPETVVEQSAAVRRFEENRTVPVGAGPLCVGVIVAVNVTLWNWLIVPGEDCSETTVGISTSIGAAPAAVELA